MAMLTIRNLPDEVHRALRVGAAQRGHSTAAEVREILAALGHKIGLTNEDFEVLNQLRDETPADPLAKSGQYVDQL